MKTESRTKLIHEGSYMAEVEVDLFESEDSWSPCLSLEDGLKLDEVREALRRGDVASATRLAKVYELTPLAG